MKKELVAELKKTAKSVYQFKAPNTDNSTPMIIYQFLDTLPYATGDNSYYATQTYFSVRLYMKNEDELIAITLEKNISNLKNVFLRSRNLGKEGELFVYHFEFEAFLFSK